MLRLVTFERGDALSFPEDRRKLDVRIAVLQWGVAVVFAGLAFAFWYFQVVQHEKFRELAENNHQRTLALRAPRGVIYDRDLRVLVENRDSFVISIVREHSRSIDRTIRHLASLIRVDEASIRETVRRHRGEPTFRPIPIVQDATLAQVAAVTAHRLETELSDVVVERVPTRRYPADALAAHLLGYVGEWREGQSVDGGRSGDIVGQSGVEQSYNRDLMGEDGARRVVVNSRGREIRTLEEKPPLGGRRIQLTIDRDLQHATEEAFRTLGYSGSAVVLDPRNGEVLSYVSLPGYDPNAFAAGIDRATWAALRNDKLYPLVNRAIRGTYAPGSTFKMVVAIAALEEGIITPDFTVHCSGAATFYGRPFQCNRAGGHGTVNLLQAIEQSCNVYFYTVGKMVGIEKIAKWAKLLGLGEKTGIDLPLEMPGLMPSPEWKKAAQGQPWYAGETISVAIGQGQVSVTPASMAVYAAALANGGMRLIPRVVRAIDDGRGWRAVPSSEPRSRAPLKPETVQAIHQAMWMVVNGVGTAGLARIDGRDVAGKTGTAQVISLEGGKAAAGRTDVDLRNNGWFVFFAPRDQPEVAGVVFAEHAAHGTEAARVGRFVLETYFAKKEGRPLPSFPSAPTAAPATERAAPGAGGVD